MLVVLTKKADRQLNKAPLLIQKAFSKQADILEANRMHPSLRAKKYDETRDIWQARINKGWRFYFRIIDDTYFIESIILHPK